MLDTDLALDRFPDDFIIWLTGKEVEILRSQIVTSSLSHDERRYERRLPCRVRRDQETDRTCAREAEAEIRFPRTDQKW